MRILAVDLGMMRTGLAISDAEERLSIPIRTISQYYLPERMVDVVAEEARIQHADCVVVGHPRNMDGSCGESALRAQDFAQRLREHSGLPVVLWDERMTTVSAIGYLNETNVRGKKRKEVVDTVAATLILQNYLDHRRLMREREDNEEANV